MRLSKKILNYRLKTLRKEVVAKGLDALLISSQFNRFYLTGWQGDVESGYLLITLKQAFLITDSRYFEEAGERAPHFEIREYGKDENFWKALLAELKLRTVGYESKDLSVFKLNKFERQMALVNFLPTEDLIELCRSQKDLAEIELIKKGARICDLTFEFILKNIKIGQTEGEIAWEMEKFMRQKGAQKNAWESFIVASGANSSKVHHAAGERKIKKGDQILLDWGCYYHGYATDISRVIFLGAPTPKHEKVYNLVFNAQKKAIEQVKVGNFNKKVDLAARSYLSSQSQFVFGHAVGHGVGLEVHELPQVNSKTKERFKVGNVVTVEPGIYEPGWGGVRIEDMVLVTNEEPKILTQAPKQIDQIIVK